MPSYNILPFRLLSLFPILVKKILVLLLLLPSASFKVQSSAYTIMYKYMSKVRVYKHIKFYIHLSVPIHDERNLQNVYVLLPGDKESASSFNSSKSDLRQKQKAIQYNWFAKVFSISSGPYEITWIGFYIQVFISHHTFLESDIS